jgi:hypothetical protein
LLISWADIINAFADVKYGENKVVTIPVDKITLANGNNGGLASNYQFVEPTNKAKATINGITYDISGFNCTININYKSYDGNVEAKTAIGFKITCSGAAYNVDDFVLNYTAASFESKDAKGIVASNPITASGFTLADSKYATDYGFKLSNTTRSFEGHINPKTLDIGSFTTSAESTFTKTYDGSDASNVVLTPTGYITGENVGYSQTAKYDNATAGENKTITISAQVSNKNYCFSNSVDEPVYTATRTLTGTITKKSLTIVVMLDKTADTTDVPANVITVEYGTAIMLKDAPIKEGYIFSGWNEVPETMPAMDIVVTGHFEADGIGALSADGLVDVYTLQGVTVKLQISVAELRYALPKGVYIVNGKRIAIK